MGNRGPTGSRKHNRKCGNTQKHTETRWRIATYGAQHPQNANPTDQNSGSQTGYPPHWGPISCHTWKFIIGKPDTGKPGNSAYTEGIPHRKCPQQGMVPRTQAPEGDPLQDQPHRNPDWHDPEWTPTHTPMLNLP